MKGLKISPPRHNYNKFILILKNKKIRVSGGSLQKCKLYFGFEKNIFRSQKCKLYFGRFPPSKEVEIIFFDFIIVRQNPRFFSWHFWHNYF